MGRKCPSLRSGGATASERRTSLAYLEKERGMLALRNQSPGSELPGQQWSCGRCQDNRPICRDMRCQKRVGRGDDINAVLPRNTPASKPPFKTSQPGGNPKWESVVPSPSSIFRRFAPLSPASTKLTRCRLRQLRLPLHASARSPQLAPHHPPVRMLQRDALLGPLHRRLVGEQPEAGRARTRHARQHRTPGPERVEHRLDRRR